MKLAFFMPMIPPTVTSQQKGVNWSAKRFYEKSELKDARNKFTAYLGHHKPSTPLLGAVRLTTKWLFPITGKHKDGEYKTSRPDTDNSVKLLKDVMTEIGFWADDAQVASEVTEKFWAHGPGIYVEVESI